MTRLDDRARLFLERRRVAHLATADARGVPHVVPICFAVIADTAYVALDEKPKRREVRDLRRVKNVLANPRAAIVADVYDDADWSRVGFILLHCAARLLEVGGAEHARAVAALRARYPQYEGMRIHERPVIACDVERMTAWGDLG